MTYFFESGDPLIAPPGFPAAPGLSAAAPVVSAAFGCFAVAGSGALGGAFVVPESVEGPSAKAGDTSMQSIGTRKTDRFIVASRSRASGQPQDDLIRSSLQGRGVNLEKSEDGYCHRGNNLTLAGIVWRRFTVWRIRRATLRVRRQVERIERLWLSVGSSKT